LKHPDGLYYHELQFILIMLTWTCSSNVHKSDFHWWVPFLGSIYLTSYRLG
jgi:hypothetical protein